MKKIIIEFIIIFITIFTLFKYNYEIKNNVEIIFNIFIKNVVPSLFPIIFISNYIKYKILPYAKNKYIKFISLLFTYAPSNSLITSDNKEILFSSIINPLFSYLVLVNYFSIIKSIIIILINITIHYIFLFYTINDTNSNKIIENINVVTLIKETTLNLINIFGVIIFFNILISTLSIFINNKLLFMLEITNGYKIISSINNISVRNILFIFLNSFGGISIFFQIKSINNDANYIYLLYKSFLSIIITIITIMII